MKDIRKKFIFAVLALSFLFCVGLQTAQAGPVIDITGSSYLMLNYNMQLIGEFRDTGSGPDGTDNTSDIYFRRNRVLFFGKVNDTLSFYLQLENTGPSRFKFIGTQINDDPGTNIYILDSYLIADFTDAFRVRAGFTKDQLTRYNNDGCFDFLSIDRPSFVYSPYQISRDTGVVVWGNLLDARVQYRVAVMEGRESKNTPKDSFRYTGRAHVSLLSPESSIHYRGTYLGKKKVLTFGAGYQVEPDVVYGNLGAKTMAKDFTAWTVDGFFEYPTRFGTFTLGSAYFDFDFDGAYQGGDPDLQSQVNGFLGERSGSITRAAYIFPRRLKGGIQVQLYGRYEDLSYARIDNSNPDFDPVYDQGIKIMAGGVNFFIRDQKFRVSLEYAKNDLDKEDPSKNVEDFNKVLTMVQLMF